MNHPQIDYDVRLDRFDTIVRAAMLEKEERKMPDEPGESQSAGSLTPEKVLSMYEKKEAGENKTRNRIRRMKRLKVCGLVAASFVLIATLSFSITMAVSENIRIAVARLVINHDQEKQVFTVSALREDVTFEEIPEKWKGDYYLTYLPDGYELQIAEKSMVVYCDPVKHWLKDSKEEGAHLITASVNFVEIPDKSYFEFPEEKCYLEPITFGDRSGLRAVYPEFDQLETIIWSADNKIFKVSTFGLSLDETIKIASGIYKTSEN